MALDPVTLVLRWFIIGGMTDSPDVLALKFGALLAAVRERSGVSQTELAKACGLRRGYVWRIENGDTLPSLRTLSRLAKGLDVSIASLVEGL